MTRAGPARRPVNQAKLSGGKPERAPLTRQKLEDWAIAYVNRFGCTASKLERHLTERVRKWGGDPNAALWIDELVTRYLGSGVLNDARFAEHLAAQLSARGKSARAIAQKLALRGVPGEIANELMMSRRQDEPGAELVAARVYARKRRLGQYRSADQRAAYRHKDLAVLARQGFSLEIAKQALGGDASAADEDF